MKNTVFIKHQITDENSLPNPDPKDTNIEYIACDERGGVKWHHFYSITVHHKWWLEERELPSEEEIIEQSEKFTKPKTFIIGVYWLMGKIGLK